MTKKQINNKIKHLDLEIQGKKGDGYFYFIDKKTGDQIGDSVYICYLNQASIYKWLAIALEARKAEIAL